VVKAGLAGKAGLVGRAGFPYLVVLVVREGRTLLMDSRCLQDLMFAMV
jgi:hypothetical protein